MIPISIPFLTPAAQSLHSPNADAGAPPLAGRRNVLRAASIAGLGLIAPGALAASATGVSPVRQSLLQVDGESFRVIEQGAGPVVLFCHGFPDTADTWRSQMRAVAAAGYRAVALDMRGFGQSFAPRDPALYTSMYTVGDLVGVLDALKIDTAVIVGHDWGGRPRPARCADAARPLPCADQHQHSVCAAWRGELVPSFAQARTG
ncbi:alpha/beta hydrolase [Oxalobacteraceae bacterium OTU3REALA1]|nr:alpha/beta hydrolase [Oxalobacteraceae bacterium OTU3REALA1]